MIEMGEFAGCLAALARHTVGDFAVLADRSWPRDNSVVWEIADSCGRHWFVKRHPTPRFHAREVNAYREWTAALGPNHTPRLAGVDAAAAAIVVSALPGKVMKTLPLTDEDEAETYRQLGELTRRLHEAAPPRDDTTDLARTVQRGRGASAARRRTPRRSANRSYPPACRAAGRTRPRVVQCPHARRSAASQRVVGRATADRRTHRLRASGVRARAAGPGPARVRPLGWPRRPARRLLHRVWPVPV